MKKKADKETKQFILIGIVTIILAVVAVYLYGVRNPVEDIPIEDNPTECVDCNTDDKNIDNKEGSDNQEEPIEKPEYINDYCDSSLTLGRNYTKYASYIIWNAVDENGCTLLNTSYNATYINKLKMKAYNSSLEHRKVFTHSGHGGSTKPDAITVLNVNGNIVGWAEIIYYSEGVTSSKWLFNGTEWVKMPE